MSLALISKVTNHFKLEGALLFHAGSLVSHAICVQMKTGIFILFMTILL